jgi:hypothetical protein
MGAHARSEMLKIGLEATLMLMGLVGIAALLVMLMSKWVEGFGVLYANPF